MFERLFGATEAEQIQNLHRKVYLTATGIVIAIIGFIISLLGQIAIRPLATAGSYIMAVAGVIMIVALFMWGWGAIKTLFGIGSIGALFSGNIVFGTILFVLCMMAAYFFSIFVAFLGMGRFIYLQVKIYTGKRS